MSKTCPNCSRTNPAEARFCYFDGACLPGTRESGPVAAGSLPFPRPFVFGNGEACRDFNQLVMGCQRNWDQARDLLRQGELERFLQGLGRIDLVMQARQAVATLDGDRALNLMLSRFPADVFQPPKLQVEPTQINLGHLRPGVESKFDVLIGNLGMGLLCGAVATDCDWLRLGDGAGVKQKLFQTIHDLHVPVQVKSQQIRAGAKPLIGRLFVDSNAGSVAVTVQFDCPVLAFPEGVLQGAMTPREVAQRAKQYPKEAALLFERGAVAQWYTSNGWIYPVEGPAGSGLGAVQQFFEALGLAKAPKVEISDDRFHFNGIPGKKIEYRLKITTAENRPVFAHASTALNWVCFGNPEFQGATVRLPFEVTVPSQPAGTLQGKISVRANGNQSFQVPITLVIDEDPNLVEAIAVAPPPPRRRDEPPDEGRRGKKKPEPTVHRTFGMARLVYWSTLIGGWSALVGWGLAELIFGRWVDNLFLAVLMVVMVASALGAGLSQVNGLITAQWRSQIRFVGPGLLGGFLGGLLGGLLANLLYLLVGQKIAFLGFLGRVLGWTLLGLSIGICEGILERHWRKFRNGLIGGSLGGFLGGLFFNPVNWIIGSPVSSRAFAFVMLGLSIGFFLSLVQVLLKEAWLTVEEGFRPGRQLILSQRITTMGTSEKASLIFIAYGAKGVEPVHVRICRRDSGRFVLEDNDSRGGTLLNDEPIDRPTGLENGDVIQLGVNRVRFHERVRARAGATD
jgi:hypothetical protein